MNVIGFLIITFLLSTVGIVICWRIMSRLQKHCRIHAQLMRCFDAGRSGNKELWEQERQKMLKLLRDF